MEISQVGVKVGFIKQGDGFVVSITGPLSLKKIVGERVNPRGTLETGLSLVPAVEGKYRWCLSNGRLSVRFNAKEFSKNWGSCTCPKDFVLRSHEGVWSLPTIDPSKLTPRQPNDRKSGPTTAETKISRLQKSIEAILKDQGLELTYGGQPFSMAQLGCSKLVQLF